MKLFLKNGDNIDLKVDDFCKHNNLTEENRQKLSESVRLKFQK